jgi:hypothetical protein
MKWKPKYFIVYPNVMNDNLKWPENWGNTCRANLAAMLRQVLNTKSVGSEIKLIWNDQHRYTVLKDNQVNYSQLDNYLKAECGMLSFLSQTTRKRADKALRQMGGEGFVYVDNYRDVILYQAHFRINKKFPTNGI